MKQDKQKKESKGITSDHLIIDLKKLKDAGKKEITVKQFGIRNGMKWIMLSDGRIYEETIQVGKPETGWIELTPLEDLKAYLASEGKEL